MDWFKDFFSKIFEGMFWSSLLSRIDWVDWFTIGFLLLGIVYGSRKGLMRILVETLELILIVYLVFAYKGILLGFVKFLLPKLSDRMLEPPVLILSAMVFWFVVAFIDKYLQKMVSAKTEPVLKMAGGAVFGALQFLIIWSFISHVLIIMPVFSMGRAYETGSSLTGSQVKGIAPFIHGMLSDPSKTLSELKA
jgi:hypothetical protein